MSNRYQTASPEATWALGKEIGSCLQPGAVVGLNGPLAAGKTWMAKGLVQGIGSYDPAWIKSPAYNLIHEYQLETPARNVFHIDFYRLDSLSAADSLLFGEILAQPDAICLVEWAEKFLRELISDYLSITLSRTDGQIHRTIHVEPVGHAPAYADLMRCITRHVPPLS